MPIMVLPAGKKPGTIMNWRAGHRNIPRRIKYLAEESAAVKMADL